MQLNGSQIVLEVLKEQGVDTIFGYPGGAILNLYDELYKQRDHFHHVLTSHEQGAAHAADGYARSTGRVGVCFATSGPGATNLVTGIGTAYMDSVPVVAITCNVGVSLLGKDSFQEIDITGITTPITKHNFIVKDVGKLADTLRRAFRIAKQGRPGPVLVDITKDVTAAKTTYEKQPAVDVERSTGFISDEALKQAAIFITKAKKPYIFVGGGACISGAQDEVRKLAELIDAPVCDTLMGKGCFSGTDDRYTGMLGMHGTKVSNLGVSDCDTLIAIGTRFSDRVLGNPKKFAHHARIVHIDVDPAEINKNVVVDASVIGDVKEVIDRLLPLIKKQDHSEWMAHIKDLKDRLPMEAAAGFTGPYIVDSIYKRTGGDAIIVTEVGQHQMWAAQYYMFDRPRQLLSSGGLGTMGYGLGAAIGAAVGNPGKRVINIAGDGCFRMNMNELITASREGVPIIEVIIDNGVLGMVRQWQDLFYDERYSETTLVGQVDYVKLSEAMGVKGFVAGSQDEFEEAIDQALSMDRPVLIDCRINQDDKVWPMVAPGTSLEECFDDSDRK